MTKQKSNGHLNGGAEGSAQTSAVSLPSAASRIPATVLEGRANGVVTGPQKRAQSLKGLENEVLSSDHGAQGSLSAAYPAPPESPEIYRYTEGTRPKYHGTQSGNSVNLALTIIRACPLGDKLAILLVLIWLPTTLLTITNTLFAVLTFVPPTLALPSFPPTLSDIFIGSGNTPSLATIFLTDIIGLLLWLVMWTPLQKLAMDWAQAVVATTLGGRGSSKKRGSDGTFLCMALVTINHMTHNDWLPRQIFGFDWSAILPSIPYVSSTPKYNEVDDGLSTTRSTVGWIRVLVALHIVIQGLVHVLRRWYQKREYTQVVRTNKSLDHEGASSSPGRVGMIIAGDTANQGASGVAPEGFARGQASKEGRDKVPTGKKKKKQGTVVRSQQPLWAAFAATKLTILREYEQSQALKEVAEAKAVDVKNLGSVPFASEADRIWIFDLQPYGFRFSMSPSLLPEMDQDLPKTAGVSADMVHVRINDTDWSSTRLIQCPCGEDDQESWQGEVYGLLPGSSYRCVFTQGKGGEILYAVTVTTPPLLSDDHG